MPRRQVDAAFSNARRKDTFQHRSIYSYYVGDGWLEFTLHFDENSRLRRLYVDHKNLQKEGGVELKLSLPKDGQSMAEFREPVSRYVAQAHRIAS